MTAALHTPTRLTSHDEAQPLIRFASTTREIRLYHQRRQGPSSSSDWCLDGCESFRLVRQRSVGAQVPLLGVNDDRCHRCLDWLCSLCGIRHVSATDGGVCGTCLPPGPGPRHRHLDLDLALAVRALLAARPERRYGCSDGRCVNLRAFWDAMYPEHKMDCGDHGRDWCLFCESWLCVSCGVTPVPGMPDVCGCDS